MRFQFSILLALLFPLVGCGHDHETSNRDASPGALRVMSFNIHHGAGTDGKVDIPRIAGLIKSQKLDLVALQEVDRLTTRVHGADTPPALSHLTGLRAHFSAAFDLMGGQYGQVILSRFPIEDVTTIQLPRIHDEQRIAIIATVRLPKGLIRFVATHLTHNNETERVGQVKALLEALDALPPLPTILAGDMNAGPGSAPIKLLRERFDDATGEDAHTFSATQPTKKIDWILLSKGHPWKVGDRQVVDDSVASDHRAVWVDLER